MRQHCKVRRRIHARDTWGSTARWGGGYMHATHEAALQGSFLFSVFFSMTYQSHTHTHTHTHTRTHTNTHTHQHTHTHSVRARAHTHTHQRTRTHANTHPHTHTPAATDASRQELQQILKAPKDSVVVSWTKPLVPAPPAWTDDNRDLLTDKRSS
jgi:hypothetical protein